MAFNIVDMLRGDIVQRQQPQQNSSSGLGEMLSYLMQSSNQPVARLSEQGQSWSPASLSELAQASANRRQEKQQEDSFAKLQELIGTKGTPGNNIQVPFRGAVLPAKGTGLRGGGSLEDFAIGLAGVPDKALAAQGFNMITDLSKPVPRPTLHSMGAPGKEGYKVNFYLDANNQPIPVGEPYKADGGININTGAGAMGNLLTPTEIAAARLPASGVYQRNPQSGLITTVKDAPQPVELKEWQAKNLDFRDRLQQANDIISKIGKDYSPASVATLRTVEDVPLVGWGVNAMVSDNDRGISQGQRQFINATLRRESGASISDSEFESAQKQYFPLPNDDDKTLAQKAKAREKVIQGLAIGIPEQFIQGQQQPDDGTTNIFAQQPKQSAQVIQMDTGDRPVGSTASANGKRYKVIGKNQLVEVTD